MYSVIHSHTNFNIRRPKFITLIKNLENIYIFPCLFLFSFRKAKKKNSIHPLSLWQPRLPERATWYQNSSTKIIISKLFIFSFMCIISKQLDPINYVVFFTKYLAEKRVQYCSSHRKISWINDFFISHFSLVVVTKTKKWATSRVCFYFNCHLMTSL